MSSTVLLGDVIELIGGGTPKTSNPEFWNGGIPWLSVVDFNKDRRWVDTTEKTITKLGLDSSSTKMLEAGDIIISARGTVGELAQLRKPMAFNQSCYGIRAGSNVDQNFLFYLLKLRITELIKLSHGGVFNTVTKETFQHMKVELPDISIQKEVSEILGVLDQKIELNQIMNETLEKIGQELFKHHFIDNPEASNWQTSALDEIADFLNGVAMQKYPALYGENTLPVIKIREMSNGITGTTDIGSAEIPKKYIIHDGDILFSWSGTLIVKPWTSGDGALNQHLFKVTSAKYPKWFYYYWLKHHLKSFIETAASKATTMGHIQRRHLSEANVQVPPSIQLDDMTKTIAPLLDRQILNDIENHHLSNLRESLMPRLMSGELRL